MLNKIILRIKVYILGCPRCFRGAGMKKMMRTMHDRNGWLYRRFRRYIWKRWTESGKKAKASFSIINRQIFSGYSLSFITTLCFAFQRKTSDARTL